MYSEDQMLRLEQILDLADFLDIQHLRILRDNVELKINSLEEEREEE